MTNLPLLRTLIIQTKQTNKQTNKQSLAEGECWETHELIPELSGLELSERILVSIFALSDEETADLPLLKPI